MKKSQKHKTPRYSEAQVTKWLSWMARNMQRHGQTVFLIEKMQVSWLFGKFERVAHWWFTILAVGLIFSPIYGPVPEPVFGQENLSVGLISGLIIGGMIGFSVGLAFSIGKNDNDITTVENTFWSWKYLAKNYRGGLKQGAFKGLIIGLIGGSIAGMILIIILKLDGLLYLLGFVPMFGLIGGLVGGLIGSITSGWEKVISQDTTFPNEGIKLTLRNSWKGLVFGLIGGLIIGLIIELNIELIITLLGDLYGRLSEGLTNYIFITLFCGLLGGLWFGGMAVIRHYTLRLFIFLKGYGPWDYTTFLDYTVEELQFLQRVGGGYIFIHRMLLEHFAEMGKKASATNYS